MGFSNNTVSYVSYRVVESSLSGEELRQTILDGLSRGRISKIDVDLGTDRSTGFALYDDPLSTDFTHEGVFFDPLVLFAFRADKLTVPATTMKLYVRRRIREHLDATRRDKMPREEREELTAAVKLDLLKKALPTINTADVVWEINTGRIRFYSTSAILNEDFMIRFNEYLGIKIQAMNAVGILESHLDERDLHDVWHLLPTSFLLGGTIEVGYPGSQKEDFVPCANDDEDNADEGAETDGGDE